ncbi:hypothetical protein [uncultured Chryseobacterium sp.]|uniref:hypothetical protein n=1 Tax=uncultured Chryseobacterium sp. TaxID=259322 RepID=UPI0025F4664C|nr:hypothetical protein [uncultured Chryseobacterium sp.]
MKKKKPDFDAAFWAGRTGSNPLPLFDAFFTTYPLSEAKEHLSSMMRYAVKRKVLSEKDPSVVFHFYLSLRSFIRAADYLSRTSGKYRLNPSKEHPSQLKQGSLSEAEYADPVLVFRRAFDNHRLAVFDHFITGIAYFSLGPFGDYPEGNTITYFLHLQKMLDAAQLMLERGEAG